MKTMRDILAEANDGRRIRVTGHVYDLVSIKSGAEQQFSVKADGEDTGFVVRKVKNPVPKGDWWVYVYPDNFKGPYKMVFGKGITSQQMYGSPEHAFSQVVAKEL